MSLVDLETWNIDENIWHDTQNVLRVLRPGYNQWTKKINKLLFLRIYTFLFSIEIIVTLFSVITLKEKVSAQKNHLALAFNLNIFNINIKFNCKFDLYNVN